MSKLNKVVFTLHSIYEYYLIVLLNRTTCFNKY
jgi:hypothetical protein